MSSEATPGSSEAKELYAACLGELGPGEAVDVESLCSAHPELAEELRELHENWRRVRGVLDRLGVGHSVHARLASRFGSSADPRIQLEQEDESADFTTRVLTRLARRKSAFGRYRVKDEVARGGQGLVLRVWDEDLRRNLAMKVVLGHASSTDGLDLSRVETRALGRFLEEAQITGQLDHPGIVPVHELGLDASGHVYFTMKLVRGRNFKEIIELVRQGDSEWTQTRALGVLLKVCEAMSYAHAKNVIHRDLKPANVMVGRYGEVYVMDWGLARVLDHPENRDLRVHDVGSTEELHSERHEHPEAPDASLETMDGDVVGTPAFMSPEQAAGRLDEFGPHTDVYAAGAMLYDLLAGQMPYVPPAAALNNYAVWLRVQEGPPAPLETLAPDVPPELVAICEKAMARSPRARYADMTELAEELRAYLEHRVVQAYRTGLASRAAKWVERNSILAATVVVALFLLLTSSGMFVVRLTQETAAKERALHARERLSLPLLMAGLLRVEDELYPIAPPAVEAMEAWIRSTTDALYRARALQEEPTPDPEIARLAAETERALASVRERMEAAAGLDALCLDDQRAAWEEASAAVAASETYRLPSGAPLVLQPQLGLIPLGENPQSGLWEFWMPLTGTRPGRIDPGSGNWAPGEETAIVLVLLPGRPDYVMGTEDPEQDSRQRTCAVDLHPFFLSKYEVTQGQWERLMDGNPSYYTAGSSEAWGDGSPPQHFDLRNPVEYLTWSEASEFCRRIDLILPTEAQWEYACRGDGDTWFWFGNELADDQRFENFTGDDGWHYPAPVGSLAPNAFGLFDVLGNVAEWCCDEFRSEFGPPRLDSGDGRCPDEPEARRRERDTGRLERNTRGGSWFAEWLTVYRMGRREYHRSEDQGVRPARALDPCPRCSG